jgi:hypothetical protein
MFRFSRMMSGAYLVGSVRRGFQMPVVDVTVSLTTCGRGGPYQGADATCSRLVWFTRLLPLDVARQHCRQECVAALEVGGLAA